MGLIQSRTNNRTPETEQTTSNAYKYPPKSGNYFGTHFFMGGEKFETMKPDVYLFGENEDLNFLGSKPSPFPYPAPHPGEPTKTLKSLVNIRKDSLKFVRRGPDFVIVENIMLRSESEESKKNSSDSNSDRDLSPDPEENPSTSYNIEFMFDTDVKCAITIYYFASEEIVNKQAVYVPKDPSMNSETFHYKRGVSQVFSQPTHVIDPSKYPEIEWQYSFNKEVIPIVIQCVVEEEEHVGHSHMTFAVVEKMADGSYVVKALKQKQMVDGLCYLLQEIYGIENKNTESVKPDDEIEDTGSECVICMCETRDTIILPCRHLCLCNGCADNLRYQANNCPICRAKFRALLQIRAIQKKKLPPTSAKHGTGTANVSLRQRDISSGDVEASAQICQDGVPSGYEAVSLVEALNGPTLPHRARQVPTTFTSDATLQSVFCDNLVSSNGDVRTVQSQQQLAGHGNQITSSVKKATLATCENDIISSSSASSISSKTKSRSFCSNNERCGEDDGNDAEMVIMNRRGSTRGKSNMADEDVTSSSVQVLNSPAEEETDRCDSSSVLPVSVRSSVANTSMDSEITSNSDSEVGHNLHNDVTPLHATRRDDWTGGSLATREESPKQNLSEDGEGTCAIAIEESFCLTPAEEAGPTHPTLSGRVADGPDFSEV